MTGTEEDELRARLHDLADAEGVTPPSVPEMLGRARANRRGARFRTSGTGLVAVVCVVGIAWGAVAVWGGRPKSQAEPAAAGPPPPACAPSWTDPSALPAGRDGADRALLPGEPVIGTACQYRSDALVGTRPLTGSELRDVVDALHRATVTASFRCPYVAGRDGVVLEFAYGSGPDVGIELSEQCPGLTNGALAQVAFNAQGTVPPVLFKLLPASGG